MALKLYMWHQVLEYLQDCLNSELGLTLTSGKIKYYKMLGYKISWKVLKIFIQDGSNDDLGSTLSFFLSQGRICLLSCYMGRVRALEDFDAQVNKNSYIGEL